MRADLEGKRFGRLLVVERVGRDKRNNTIWRCTCDCGEETLAISTKLMRGRKRSCGCLVRETKGGTTHGMYGSRIWTIWSGMKGRCAKTKGKDFHNYAARGIKVCDEWKSFESFYAWATSNGYKDDLTIERIDGNKGYCPENCKWATWTEQARNRRNNDVVTVGGESRTLVEWAEITGKKYDTIVSRIVRGWSPYDAVTTPIQKHKPKGA